MLSRNSPATEGGALCRLSSGSKTRNISLRVQSVTFDDNVHGTMFTESVPSIGVASMSAPDNFAWVSPASGTMVIDTK